VSQRTRKRGGRKKEFLWPQAYYAPQNTGNQAPHVGGRCNPWETHPGAGVRERGDQTEFGEPLEKRNRGHTKAHRGKKSKNRGFRRKPATKREEDHRKNEILNSKKKAQVKKRRKKLTKSKMRKTEKIMRGGQLHSFTIPHVKP